MKKIILLGSIFFILAGCESASKLIESKPSVVIVTQNIYPELPDIELPTEIKLLPMNVDVPRDMTKREVINKKECLDVLDKDRNNAFWERCGQFAVILNSNIFLGFDQTNWNNFVINMKMSQEELFKLRERIHAINEQRAKWRKMAEDERKRIEEERQKSQK